ncbi:MAG: discoidin domain-containing protein [Streptosporangiaceae bacterium]
MPTSGNSCAPHPRRAGRFKAFGAAVALTLVGAGFVLPTWAADAAVTPFIQSPLSVAGRGATVPFTEFEAEDPAHATTNGQAVGPDRVYGNLPSEASGRRAIKLDAVGEYVEFTLTKPANAVSVRYSVPDTSAGTGLTAPIDLRINGTKLKDLDFTSKYGWYYGGYPFGNQPGNNPHHFYDETRTMFGSTLPAGAKVRFQVSSTAVASSFTLDLADFELVAAPAGRPAGSLSVDDFGAVKNSPSTDNTAAFQAAVDAGKAQGKTVFVPEGNYTLWDHVIVDGVTLQGAGPWYSVLGGRHPTNRNRAVGVYGKYVQGGGYTGPVRPNEANGPSRNVTLKDFAIIGDIQERVDDDQVNAMGGAMSDSVVDNVWMQHTKVGAWMDGPMNNFTLKNSRILDQTADGVNFHTGVTNSAVTNTFLRNLGDDGLASWPERIANTGDSFTHNTVILPILANNIVTYGGKDWNISDNVVSDTVSNGGGIHVANRYPGVNGATGVSGTITLARNTLIRAGNSDFNWNFGVGAIWFDGLNEPINATINVTDTDIFDSSYAAIHMIEGATKTVNFKNVNIDGVGTYGIQAQTGATMTWQNVKLRHVGAGFAVHNCVGTSFVPPTDTNGNSGWSSGQTCTGNWPAPNYVYPGPGGTDPEPTVTPTEPTPTPTVTTPPTCTPGTGDLARGKPVTASSQNGGFPASSSNDGNADSYWESNNNAWPQTLTVDLCAAASIGQVVVKVPPASAWATRTQTFSVLGSTDGTNFATLAPSAARTFNPATGNSVTVPFTATSARQVRLQFTGNSGWPAAQVATFEVAASGVQPTQSPSPSPTPTPTVSPPAGNLALSRTLTASSAVQDLAASRANDGNADSYWESNNDAWPQTLTLDLGSAQSVRRIVLKLPPAPAWGARSQTLSVLGGDNGSTFTSVQASQAYAFNPATGNTVTINIPVTTKRYLRLNITGNTGWPAGQVSEFEAYAS